MWLCTKFSVLCSWPKSLIGSDHKISHMSPDIGGSQNRSSCDSNAGQHVQGTNETIRRGKVTGVMVKGSTHFANVFDRVQ